MDQPRYMAYLAWDKITVPMECGSLGIRDLGRINESLILKFLWKLAAGSQALWVEVVKAKYLPRSDLWYSARLYKCTNFWRAIMNLRPTMLPWLTWRLGDGSGCRVFAQPWAEGVVAVQPTGENNRRLVVRDLVDGDTGIWNMESLMGFFGYMVTLQIIQNVPPPMPNEGTDTLIFKHNTNGVFTVRKAYQLLQGEPM